MMRIRTGAVLLLAVLLAGCASLPRGAALKREVLVQPEKAAQEYALYPVTRALLPEIASWPRTGGDGGSWGWIQRSRGPATQVIAPGDKIDLTVWDSEENSLLTSAGQKVVQLNGAIVSPAGTIFVPYLDDIRVSGMTPDAARRELQRQMEAIIPSAQVQIALAAGRRNSVDLVGGVANPGSYPLPDRDFTVLGLISQGGGVPATLRNPVIRLVRDGRSYATSISNLYENPDLDTTLRGGDQVIVTEDKRYFLALGASGKEDTIYFTQDHITALDAVTLIGGISNSRADPEGILILREYPREAVRADSRGPSHTRVIFVLDLTAADGLFSAGRFQIMPGDLVLATESPLTAVQTVFGLVGSVFGLANTASNATN
jgi:polysaccharide export outer membrane protein